MDENKNTVYLYELNISSETKYYLDCIGLTTLNQLIGCNLDNYKERYRFDKQVYEKNYVELKTLQADAEHIICTFANKKERIRDELQEIKDMPVEALTLNPRLVSLSHSIGCFTIGQFFYLSPPESRIVKRGIYRGVYKVKKGLPRLLETIDYLVYRKKHLDEILPKVRGMSIEYFNLNSELTSILHYNRIYTVDELIQLLPYEVNELYCVGKNRLDKIMTVIDRILYCRKNVELNRDGVLSTNVIYGYDHNTQLDSEILPNDIVEKSINWYLYREKQIKDIKPYIKDVSVSCLDLARLNIWSRIEGIETIGALLEVTPEKLDGLKIKSNNKKEKIYALIMNYAQHEGIIDNHNVDE